MHPFEQPRSVGDKIEAFFTFVLNLIKLVFCVLLLLAVGWFLWHLGPSDPEPTRQGAIQGDGATPDQVTIAIPNERPGDAELVERAVKVFARACPDLFGRFSRDVEKIEAIVYDQPLAIYLAEQYGWERNVALRVKLSDEVETIPSSWRASGHTLHYELGAGREPGIRSQKEQSQLACGFPPDSERDVFTPVPELAFLDE